MLPFRLVCVCSPKPAAICRLQSFGRAICFDEPGASVRIGFRKTEYRPCARPSSRRGYPGRSIAPRPCPPGPSLSPMRTIRPSRSIALNLTLAPLGSPLSLKSGMASLAAFLSRVRSTTTNSWSLPSTVMVRNPQPSQIDLPAQRRQTCPCVCGHLLLLRLFQLNIEQPGIPR